MNDPYFDTSLCVERLYNEYNTHKKLVVALDFDDSIFDYHKKGYSYNRIIDLIKECQKLGFYIVLFTGTPKDKWEGQIEFCRGLGIEIVSVNKNPINLPFGNDGKIYYNILLDDRAGLGQSYEILTQTIDKIKENNK